MFLVWAGRSRLLRTGGLRSRPHPGPGAFASGRAASGAVATVRLIGRRQHPPAFGRAAPVPAPFARPRPSKACSPFRSSAFSCLSGASAGRSATVRHPEHLQPDATASLAPQVAAQSPFYHLPPARRAPPSLAVSVLPSPTHTSRPSPPRPTPGALISVLRNLDRSALRLPAGFEKQTYCSSSGSAAAVLGSDWLVACRSGWLENSV